MTAAFIHLELTAAILVAHFHLITTTLITLAELRWTLQDCKVVISKTRQINVLLYFINKGLGKDTQGNIKLHMQMWIKRIN